MAIQSISSAGNNAANMVNIPNAGAAAADNARANAAQEAAIFDKSDPSAVAANVTYTRDTVTLSEISKQVEAKLSTLRSTVERLVSMQSVKTGEAQGLTYDQIMEKYNGRLREFYQSLEVDEETRLNAQQEVSEDGFWGVKQTSARLLGFAKALSGGDPSKIELMKSAIEEGYKAAEEAWGGELPEICQQTKAAVMKGLEDWTGETEQKE